MKIALVHDYIKEYGGAERVLESLHEVFPDADVFTTVYLPSYLGPHKKRFANWKIHTSFLQYLPFKQKLISPIRLVSNLAFKSFDFSKYDVVITSATGAYFPNSLDKKSAILICYCHTPPRYLYGYATAREWKKNIVFKILGETANHFLRMADYKSSKNVDFFVANSEEVKRRIEKFYRKDATVIYPPVNVSNKESGNENQGKEDYFLTGGRLARPKHIDLIVQACTEMGLPLKVFGKSFAGYGDELKELAGETVEFLGEVTDEEKTELMKHAKAFIFASVNEDFGIVPVEAMGHGTPVVAYKSGGVKETVIDGKTGVFFNELNLTSLKEGIKRFETLNIDPRDCVKQAEKFGENRFMKEIKDFVSSKASK